MTDIREDDLQNHKKLVKYSENFGRGTERTRRGRF